MINIIAEKGKTIPLGHTGENLARCVFFNVQKWQEAYGDGDTFIVVAKPEVEEPYAKQLPIDGDNALWEVENTDVDVVGNGKCELQYVVNNVLVKSEQWDTCVYESLGDSPYIPPEKYLGYVVGTIIPASNISTLSITHDLNTKKVMMLLSADNGSKINLPNMQVATWGITEREVFGGYSITDGITNITIPPATERTYSGSHLFRGQAGASSITSTYLSNVGSAFRNVTENGFEFVLPYSLMVGCRYKYIVMAIPEEVLP